MEEKELKVEDIPKGYPLCFNNECADKDRCMHYQARLLMPKERYYGAAVYPTSWALLSGASRREYAFAPKTGGDSESRRHVWEY